MSRRLSEMMKAEISTESLSYNNKDSLGIPTETLRNTNDGVTTTTTEDEVRRQEQESIELARQLMEEEAMASYEQHFGMIREDELSPEDFAALQSALREETDDDGGEDDYDAMLELSERIGNVKTERWTMIARKMIDKLESFEYSKNHPHIADEEAKCLVCQCDYEEGDRLRRLPCNHCFHQECVDEWLLGNDACPYCRKGIVEENDADTK